MTIFAYFSARIAFDVQTEATIVFADVPNLLDSRGSGRPALPPAVCRNPEAHGCESLHQPAHTNAGQLELARARADGELAFGVRCHA